MKSEEPMQSTYFAAKDLVIGGRRYARGEPIDPAAVDPQRLQNGVRIGAILTERPADPPAPPNPSVKARKD